MAFCYKCGNEVEKYYNFCIKCGEKVISFSTIKEVKENIPLDKEQSDIHNKTEEPSINSVSSLEENKSNSNSVKQDNDTTSGTGFIIGLIILGLIFYIIFKLATTDFVGFSTFIPAAIRNDNSTTSMEEINTTLSFVAEQMDARVDVNNDGLVNCIDAAVLFYQFFPDKSRVRIIANDNDRTRFYHLFNSVLIDGEWIPIEPQSKRTGHQVPWMTAVWGTDKYDPRLNKAATLEYRRYIK